MSSVSTAVLSALLLGFGLMLHFIERIEEIRLKKEFQKRVRV